MVAFTFLSALVWWTVAVTALVGGPHQRVRNLAVYHVHPPGYPVAPINANTADLRGYVFFSVDATLLQSICRLAPTSPWCHNPEVMGPNLLITQLTLEVDTSFGPYGHCNICINGSTPEQKLPTPCKDGEYVCDCADHGEPFTPCGAKVGRIDVGQRKFPNSTDPIIHIYQAAAQKIGGLWYSTTAQGQCPPLKHVHDCSWRLVRVEQRIEKACAERIIWDELAKRNASCFGPCEKRGPASPCWMLCFLAAVVGVDKDGKELPGSIPLRDMEDIWRLPFRPPAKGGCPRLPVPSSVGMET